MLQPRADHSSGMSLVPPWGIPIAYAIAVLARSSIIIVVPTLAYQDLGETSLVSAIYLGASLIGLLGGVALSAALQTLGPWRLLLIASLAGLAAAVLFCIRDPVALIAGLTLHLFMVQFFEAATNVYALNAIPRLHFSRFEPRRILLTGVAYILGPLAGGWLIQYGSFYLPFVLSGVCALLVPVCMARVLRATPTLVRPPKFARATGGVAVREFFRNPRLRLAWVLAVGRAGWWQMFFVYMPILIVTGGVGVAHAGTLAGIASGVLLLAPLWGLVLRLVGMRRLFFVSYAVCGTATAVAGLLVDISFGLAALALIVAAVAVSAIDSAGNAPFMRALRSREQMRMVPIYNTYREMSQIVPSAVYAIILTAFSLPSVFLVTGIALAILATACLKLPRRA